MRILGLGAAVVAMSLASPALAADMDKEKKPGGEQESSQQQPSETTQQNAGQAATSSEAKSEGKNATSTQDAAGSSSSKSTGQAQSGTQPGTDTSESSSTTRTFSEQEGKAAESGGTKSAGDKAEGKEVGKDVNEPMNVAGSEGKKLIGKMLIGAEDQEVGEVKDVLMTDDGMLQSVLVDVGGFLGIGAKTVAVPADKIEIQGDKVIARDLTKETAENMAEYKATRG